MASVPEPSCSIARSLGVLGERWTFLILRDAFLGKTRFAEFRESLGVAPDILSDRLATLVSHGVMEREPYQEPGARSRSGYRLTPAGRELHVVLSALQQWGDEHLPRTEGPSMLRRVKGTSRPVHVGYIDERGREVDAADVAVIPAPAPPPSAWREPEIPIIDPNCPAQPLAYCGAGARSALVMPPRVACCHVIVESLRCGLEHPNSCCQFRGIRALERDRPNEGERIGQFFPELHPGAGDPKYPLALVFGAVHLVHESLPHQRRHDPAERCPFDLEHCAPDHAARSVRRWPAGTARTTAWTQGRMGARPTPSRPGLRSSNPSPTPPPILGCPVLELANVSSACESADGLNRVHPWVLDAVLCRDCARSSTDRASDYGSEGWGFESLRARHRIPR